MDNERNLNREKFRDFWIKRCDHAAGYPLERWNVYENELDINKKIHVKIFGTECIFQSQIPATLIIKVFKLWKCKKI